MLTLFAILSSRIKPVPRRNKFHWTLKELFLMAIQRALDNTRIRHSRLTNRMPKFCVANDNGAISASNTKVQLAGDKTNGKS